jgi:uncharacterized membrane protein
MNLVHRTTFRLNSLLFLVFIGLAIFLWPSMPDRYPVHFGVSGDPTRWAEGPGMWILLVAVCTISFAKAHLFQHFLFMDPNSTLLNVPYKQLFQKLPTERKIPVVRRVNRLLGLVNTGMLLLFICTLLLTYHTAHNPGSIVAVLANRALLLIVVLILVVPVVESLGLRRMIFRKLQEEGLVPGAAHSATGSG